MMVPGRSTDPWRSNRRAIVVRRCCELLKQTRIVVVHDTRRRARWLIRPSAAACGEGPPENRIVVRGDDRRRPEAPERLDGGEVGVIRQRHVERRLHLHPEAAWCQRFEGEFRRLRKALRGKMRADARLPLW